MTVARQRARDVLVTLLPRYHVLLSCFVMLIFAMTCVTLLCGGFGRHGADLLRRNQMKPDITRYSQVESARWFHFSAHRGLMPVSPSPVNIMNDMMFTMFIVGKQEIVILH